MNLSTNPVSALQIAIRKITAPRKACHGFMFALIVYVVPGNINEKNEINHCKRKVKIIKQALIIMVYIKYSLDPDSDTGQCYETLVRLKIKASSKIL